MLKVGITGGIGSGKSTVCKIFETLGIKVYYADERARYLMEHDETLIQQLKDIFGPQIYTATGSLHRQLLASKVFHDKELLEQLNAVVHPAVAADVAKWAQQYADEAYVLKEAALLYESGSYKELDKVITVYAPEEKRISWLLKRDNTTEEAIRARMNNQMSDEEKKERADFVIYNNGQRELIPQVMAIDQALRKLAAK